VLYLYSRTLNRGLLSVCTKLNPFFTCFPDSSGEAYEDCPSSPEELYRRLADLHVDQRRADRRPVMRAASAAAALAPAPVIREVVDAPRGPMAGDPALAPGRRRRRHSHCVGADPRPLYVRQPTVPQRKPSFSRGQLLAGITSGAPR